MRSMKEEMYYWRIILYPILFDEEDSD